jgi:2-oxoglutarate ferredoxin oxidoreductase subunit gamma
VVISDEEIGSPFVHHPSAVIAMNRPSLDKYEALVKPGGVLIINTSMTDRKAVRKDIKVIEIAANEEAEKLGDQRMANMILLGALLANLPVLPQESIKKALKGHLPERHQKLLSKNFDALQEGARYIP